ncbi:DUF1801 domain-containing protein [uncultured Parasphingorhabdus sp.]|uniref:DUF1801 domain-containing protein n=1 Tax=uncultured Parasphingorhabdus sp. TaxID=2709694 RepID=UPI0030DB0C22
MEQSLPAETADIFDRLPEEMAGALRNLRALILETAAENPAVGPLQETLKWGEPAFLPSASKSGTTVRINAHKKSGTRYAFYVHCSTDLVERYRALYSDVLQFEGSRAVLFDLADALPVDAVKHCVAMALTYHLRTD